jgi:hypothetical protein
MGMTHWTPDGGSTAECGEPTKGQLAVASMAGVNCPECREMVMASIDAIRPGAVSLSPRVGEIRST